MSASAAPGDRPLTVMSAVRAPAARAAASAAFVAAVPPSWETPMTRPVAGGSSASSNACAATDRAGARQRRSARDRLAQDLGDAERRVLRRAAAGDDDRLAGARPSRRMAAASSAAPLPAASWRARIRAASAGSASIMSVMWNGGPARAARLSSRRPRVGRAGQRGGRVEVGVVVIDGA